MDSWSNFQAYPARAARTIAREARLNASFRNFLLLSLISLYFFASLCCLPFELFETFVLLISHELSELRIDFCLIEVALVANSGDVVFINYCAQVDLNILLLTFQDLHFCFVQIKFNYVLFVTIETILVYLGFLPVSVVGSGREATIATSLAGVAVTIASASELAATTTILASRTSSVVSEIGIVPFSIAAVIARTL